jgi:tRNA pseudouridine32 synthase/23S rRNA pseudouridine746 synthase
MRSLLVRLEQRLALDELVPLHRIDRDTAGLLVFSAAPATRNAYHALFRAQAVAKRYEAIAPWNPDLPWPRDPARPRRRRSRTSCSRPNWTAPA